MNDFEYIIATKKLESFKTFKAYDEFIRHHFEVLRNMVYNNRITPALNLYRCITNARNRYNRYDNMPGHIKTGIDSFQYEIGKQLMAKGTTPDIFWQTFEFDEKIHLRTIRLNNIEELSNIIANTELHKPIEFNIYGTDEGRGIELGANSTSSYPNQVMGNIIDLEILKARRNKPYLETVIEHQLQLEYVRLTSNRTTHSTPNSLINEALLITRAINEIARKL